MPYTDLPLEQLREYRPEVAEPAGFDEFWSSTLAAGAGHDGVSFEPVDSGLLLVRTYDVTFDGYGGAPIRGWLHVPADAEPGSLPLVVHFLGFSTGRGLPHEDTIWAQAGFAHFIMDTRGHGAKLTVSHTTDPDSAAGGPGVGRMTSGIRSERDYVYRRIFVDAVHAVRAARSHPLVDPARTVVSGKSQGGAIALAAAALAPGVTAALVDVPFLSHFARAAGVASLGPYLELAQYLQIYRDEVDAVFATLSYFDAVNFARRSTVPALFSVGLMDPVSPPSTVFAVFNAYAGDKALEVYPFNAHEGGGANHLVKQLNWVRSQP
jgi:cephalosporin-C deacetylase